MYMYTSTTSLSIYIYAYMEKTPAWNSLCLDELRNYGQVECSGWAYGILILAARAATRFPRQLLEFRAISRKRENNGNLDKTF